MVLHELSTNAVKYGALSVEGGEVRLGWTIQPRDGEIDRVDLVWRELGGPPVSPPKRRGFGSRLIVGGLAHQLDGEVRLEFDAAGVVCEIGFEQPRQPVTEMLRVGDAA